MDELLSKNDAAQYLGISEASIRNWMRQGIIKSIIKDKKKYFTKNDVEQLKTKIENGEIKRLTQRVNKSKAKNKFIPTEYVGNIKSINTIRKIVGYILNNHIKTDHAVFLISMNLFCKSGDLLYSDIDTLFEFSINKYRRKGVQEHLSSWFNTISSGYQYPDYENIQYLLNFNLPEEEDICGIIYQSIIHEGEKSGLGSYYTPEDIVKNLIKNDIENEFRVLDPCCGTGQFLLNFSQFISIPENIYGFDIDKNAVEIAKTNLLLKYGSIDFTPNIFKKNTLIIPNISDIDKKTNIYNSYFDVIATNPPWGAKYERNILEKMRSNYPEINSKESFSFFILQSYKMLKSNGKMSFVLPESITNVKIHTSIREFILRNTDILNVEILGRKFKNVLSSVITIKIRKSKSNSNTITITDKLEKYFIKQKRFFDNKNYLFDVYVNEIDKAIFNKIESCQNVSLKNNARWALGIVTGDNNKFLSNESDGDREPIFKGNDVNKFILSRPSHYIKFVPKKFQQVAPAYKYRAKEKLIRLSRIPRRKAPGYAAYEFVRLAATL